MGATNEIKGTNITLKLADLNCSYCLQKFTDDKNFELWFDTSNDVQLEKLDKGYYLSIWVRSIEHEDCPETETCEGCNDKFLKSEMKELQGDYYCKPCYQQKIKDHGAE